MAMPTPIFSLKRIWSVQMMAHGNSASTKSAAAEYPPPRFPMKMICGRMLAQVPGVLGIHDFWIGSAATQFMVAFRAMMRFMVTRMNQTNHLTQPSENRSRVTAKAVLLHAAAVMARVFLTHWNRSSSGAPHW
jgi:hypothetical protein